MHLINEFCKEIEFLVQINCDGCLNVEINSFEHTCHLKTWFEKVDTHFSTVFYKRTYKDFNRNHFVFELLKECVLSCQKMRLP